jgi:hypothetical protein
MVASASLANPDAALKAYLPLFYKKLIKTNKESGAGTTLLWHLGAKPSL